VKRQLLIDITRPLVRSLRGGLPTGVDRVNLEYIRHFANEALAVVVFRRHAVTLSKAASQSLFKRLLRQGPYGTAHTLGMAAHVAAAVSASVFTKVLRRHLHRSALLLNTGHRGLEHATYALNLRTRGVRPVFLVHDLIPITHPEYCRHGEGERHRRRMRHAASLGAGIIVNSQQTLSDFHHYIHALDLASPPALVAPLGVGLTAEHHDEAPLSAPYFVMLGTIEPRKNHALVLTVWRRLVERWGDAVPKLVLIGQRGWECEHIEDILDRSAHAKAAVIELRRCDDRELRTYLRHARALLFPSFAEGFGLPLVEALAHGTPVIASNLKVFKEVAGDVPHYIDPTDGPGLMAAIEDYAQPSSALRQAQLERMTRFVAPSWQEHLQKADHFLASLGE
jgi:glycosyltransferase involved in cell wall biosynthesis